MRYKRQAKQKADVVLRRQESIPDEAPCQYKNKPPPCAGYARPPDAYSV